MASVAQVDGIISGLKTSDIIQQLMAIERRPLTLLQQKADTTAQRLKAVQGLRGQLVALQSAVARLLQRGTVNAKLTSTDTPATSPTVVSATAGPDAINGSFKVTVQQLATATKVLSSGPIGQVIDRAAPLASAGFRLTPITSVNGTPASFTINGRAITVDDATTLDDGTANSIVARINAAGAGVTASLVADADGRANNRIRLVAAPGQTIQLGSGADTSNLLRVLGLEAAAQVGDTMLGTTSLGVTDTSQPLAASRLATPIAGLDGSGNGSFTVNGVSIGYRATDSIATIVNRINASNAGLTAFYDPVQDRLRLAAAATGARTIALADVTGNFLAATGLLGASQTLGSNAAFSIDAVNGGQTLTSTSNTVSGYLPGVTLELKSASATPVTVTVDQDPASTVAAVQGFVDTLNAALDAIRAQTKYDPSTKQAAVLTGDSGVLNIERMLRSLTSSAALGASGTYRSLADLGISSGAIGSAVGSTTRLSLDEGKLTAALRDNPRVVAQVLAGFAASVGTPSGPGNVTAVAGTPLNQHESGTFYVKVLDTAGSAEVRFVAGDGRQLYTRSGTLTPGSQDSGLIPGLTLQVAGALTPGEDSFAVTVDNRGVGIGLGDYLDNLLGPTGFFAARQDASEAESAALSKNMADYENRLKSREDALVRRFSALEQTLATLQAQSGSFLTQLARLNGPAS